MTAPLASRFLARHKAAVLLGTAFLSACAPSAPPVVAWPKFQISAVEGGRLPPVTGASLPPSQALPDAQAPGGAADEVPPGGASTPPSPQASPARGGSGGGSGGGGPSYTGQIVDRHGRAIAGATLLFTTGARGVSDADGQVTVTGMPSSVACSIFAPGYVTSTLVGGELPAVLHLERRVSADPDFEGNEFTVRGQVSWPEAAPLGALIYYTDDMDSVANPVVPNEDGQFAIRIVARRAGSPTGMLVALAETAGGTRMYGVSPVFAPAEPTEDAIVVTGALADQTVNFSVGPAPAGLDEVHHRLEIARGEVAPFAIQTAGTTSGSYAVPAAGALGAALRIAVEAADEAFEARSTIALDPYNLPASPPGFLSLPTLGFDAGLQRATWSVPTATSRVHLALADGPRFDAPVWEGWVEDRGSYDFPDTEWPTGASATGRLVAYEGADATTRRVASVNHLRLVPAGDWTGGFRSAEVRATFVP